MRGWFDVSDFGAVGDGKTWSHEAIQASIDKASEETGGVVWIPPGRYLIGKQLVIDRQVTLLGAGWASGDPNQGSWLVFQILGVNLQIRASGTTVSGIGFFQEQPIPDTTYWQPRDNEYNDFILHVGADDISLKDINLYNCTNGIKIRHFLEDRAIGRVVLDHIWGRPLRRGIEIDNAQDVIKINDVHFWPFWEGDNEIVDNWVKSNGTAIHCSRADNPMLSNIFVLGYEHGIAFSSSSYGATSKFAIVNADCDFCEVGIQIGGLNATGSITNLNTQGGPGRVGIEVISGGVRLFASNLRITNYRTNAIRATGINVRLFISNLWTELWNRSGRGFPGVEAVDGAIIYLGRPIFFDRGKGAPNFSLGVLTGLDETLVDVPE